MSGSIPVYVYENGLSTCVGEGGEGRGGDGKREGLQEKKRD